MHRVTGALCATICCQSGAVSCRDLLCKGLLQSDLLEEDAWVSVLLSGKGRFKVPIFKVPIWVGAEMTLNTVSIPRTSGLIESPAGSRQGREGETENTSGSGDEAGREGRASFA